MNDTNKYYASTEVSRPSKKEKNKLFDEEYRQTKEKATYCTMQQV